MTKYNENIINSTNNLLFEIMKFSAIDKVKVEIIKEEIKNNSYMINSKNISHKILELAKVTEEDVVVD